MHRRLLVLVAIVVAALGSTAAPAHALYPGFQCPKADNAGYDCNTRVSTLSYYKGWGHVDGVYCGGAVPTDEMLAGTPRAAWRWNSSYGWQRVSLSPGTRIYVWPYAVAWSWVWTQSTGWLALHDADIVINPWCDPTMPVAPGFGRWGG